MLKRDNHACNLFGIQEHLRAPHKDPEAAWTPWNDGSPEEEREWVHQRQWEHLKVGLPVENGLNGAEIAVSVSNYCNHY